MLLLHSAKSRFGDERFQEILGEPGGRGGADAGVVQGSS